MTKGTHVTVKLRGEAEEVVDGNASSIFTAPPGQVVGQVHEALAYGLVLTMYVDGKPCKRLYPWAGIEYVQVEEG